MPDKLLYTAVDYLLEEPAFNAPLPEDLPLKGMSTEKALEMIASGMFTKSARLDGEVSFAHMDPPTPCITWIAAMFNARFNQNMLHEALSPFAHEAEEKIIRWVSSLFGMQGGHMCSGSTLANLTSLWAARKLTGAQTVIASQHAHISIQKSADILGMNFKSIAVNNQGELDVHQLPDLNGCCLVLTAGTTSTGAIDNLHLARNSKANWVHIDAAWAGPLQFSDKYKHILEGIEHSDSIAFSAHKWLFQPKESALVLFKDIKAANSAVSYGGGYLASPNIGVQGSRGAAAIPLLATVLAWGKEGISSVIESTFQKSLTLEKYIISSKKYELLNPVRSGVLVFRPATMSTNEFFEKIPENIFSTCYINNELWVRSVCANPLADVNKIIERLETI